jgi:chaperone modulatory protein CbpM
MNSPFNDGAGALLRAEFLADDDWLRVDEVCLRLRVERDWLTELVEIGALEPRGGADPSAWLFARRELPRVLAMSRLVSDLGVNLAGAAIIVDLVEERRRLLGRLAALSGG